MIWHVTKTSFMSGIFGFLAVLAQNRLEATFLTDFLQRDLLTLLVALLAINSATTGIVLTKIRELVERHGHADLFRPTRDQMILAVREQIGLIVVSIILFTLSSSALLHLQELRLLIDSLIVGIFVFALHVLYDTAIGVLVILDFKVDKTPSN